MNKMKMSRLAGHHCARHVIWSCALIIATMLACVSIAAQTVTPKPNEIADSKPKAEPDRENKTTLKPATNNPAPQASKQLKIGAVNFNGSLRLRVNYYGWFETPNFEDNYTFGEVTLRLSLGQQKEKYDWQGGGGVPVIITLPSHRVVH